MRYVSFLRGLFYLAAPCTFPPLHCTPYASLLSLLFLLSEKGTVGGMCIERDSEG